MQANRRRFMKTAGILALGMFCPSPSIGVGLKSQIQLMQLVYPGGNWRPRPTALRRLAWEVHKRTAVDTALEPIEAKLTTQSLSPSPLAYLSGDRGFTSWSPEAIVALRRFITLGGTLIVDTAFSPEGNPKDFEISINTHLKKVLPSVSERNIPKNHVLYRSFYQIDRPVGRIAGPGQLTGYDVGGRLAVIRTQHDLGGAWARDNLGNWEFEVRPGGEQQREVAFRLGVNMVMYSLCLDYKNETPHRRFKQEMSAS